MTSSVTSILLAASCLALYAAMVKSSTCQMRPGELVVLDELTPIPASSPFGIVLNGVEAVVSSVIACAAAGSVKGPGAFIYDNRTCNCQLGQSRFNLGVKAAPGQVAFTFSKLVKCDLAFGFYLYKYNGGETCLWPTKIQVIALGFFPVKDFDGAVKMCQSVGGYVLTIKTQAKFTFLKREFPDLVCWAGVDTENYSEFKWLDDGSPVSSDIWDTGNPVPTTKCAAFHATTGLRSDDCANGRLVMCELY